MRDMILFTIAILSIIYFVGNLGTAMTIKYSNCFPTRRIEVIFIAAPSICKFGKWLDEDIQ